MRVSVKRTVMTTALVAAVAGLWTPAVAQLGISRSDQKVLVLWPVPGSTRGNSAADTALALRIGDELRDKLDVKERFKMRVQTRARICEVLIGSGYKCPELLDADNSERLAGAMGPDAYIVGVLTHNSRPTLHLRLVDLKKTGISGWVTIVGDTGWKADQFASIAVDSIDSGLRGAEAARDCYDNLDHNNVKGAREKVNEAFKLYPNQPAAAMCLVRIFETNRAGTDSIIFALQKATRGDSMNAKAWERLANAYLEKNDMLRAVEARTQQLNASPRNSTLRYQVAAGWVDQKQYQKGVDILDVGLQENPLEAQWLQLKQRACVDGQLWKCALSALTALYDADTTVRPDSVFYAKTFGAAQALNDTAAMLKWSGEAVKRVPNSLTLWRARALALKTAGKADSALLAYQKVITFDTTDVSYTLLVAQGLINGFTVDTATPLDRDKLNQIDLYLNRVVNLSHDSTMKGTIAQLYAGVGLKLAQSRKYDALSDTIMLKSLSLGLKGRATEPVNFFLGVHYFEPLRGGPGKPSLADQIRALATHTPPRNPTAAEAAQGCALLAQELEAIAKTRPTITIGMNMTPQTQGTGRTILQYLTSLEGQVPTVKQIFKCK